MNLSTINDSRDIKTNTPDGRAYRVDITNQPVSVSVLSIGDSLNVYNEALSVAGLATTTIVDYTVPVAKEVFVKNIEFSGENRAVFSIEINNVIQNKYRTYFTEYNGSVSFKDYKLVEGDNIKIIVENKTNSTADFNANMIAGIKDA